MLKLLDLFALGRRRVTYQYDIGFVPVYLNLTSNLKFTG